MRIVSNELWSHVQDRLKVVNEKMTRRRIGGLNRAKKRDYLFSGLLTCGVCGHHMTIGSSHADKRSSAYGCVSWRYKRGCTNNLWIKENRLTAQLVEALANELLVPEVMDYFIASVSRELDQYLKGHDRELEGGVPWMQAKAATLDRSISSLVDAIANPIIGCSPALLEKLAASEAEREQLKRNIVLLSTSGSLSKAKTDIAAMVRSNISNLLDVIKQDVPKARQVLQRHIKKLELYPTVTANGPGYEVIGEIDLFKPAPGNAGRVLLDCSSTGTVQQYTEQVDFIFRFAGLVIYSDVDPGPNPLVAPLAELLGSNPVLLHEPKFACGWAELIKSVLPSDSELYSRVNDDYVAWNFRNRTNVFAEQFGMTTIAENRRTWYMFSKVDAGLIPKDEAQAECGRL
jgi:hypothetical protein